MVGITAIEANDRESFQDAPSDLTTTDIEGDEQRLITGGMYDFICLLRNCIKYDNNITKS